MNILKTFIAQLSNDGTSVSPVTPVDILATYNIGTEDFPLVYLPETKELPTLSFNDEDGEEVYIPAERKVEAYDMTVKFLYSGTKATFRSDINGFIDFLYGRNEEATGSRLVIYDEHVKDGRKDITVKSVSSDMFFWMDDEDQVVAEFSVDFRVHNPNTPVVLHTTKTVSGSKTVYTYSLTW